MIKFGVPKDTFDETQCFAATALVEIGFDKLPGTERKESQLQEALWCRGLLLKGGLTIEKMAAHNNNHTGAIDNFQAEGLITTDGSGLQSSSLRCEGVAMQRYFQELVKTLAFGIPLACPCWATKLFQGLSSPRRCSLCGP